MSTPPPVSSAGLSGGAARSGSSAGPGHPERTSGGRSCLVGGCAGCAVAGVVVGIACIALVWLGVSAVESGIAAQLRDNPVVVEHLGRLEEVDVDIIETGAIPEPDVIAFRLRGTRGSALARLDTDPDDATLIRAGTIQLEDGTVLDLFAERGEDRSDDAATAPGAEAPEGEVPDP